jgi:hypothetical protein
MPVSMDRYRLRRAGASADRESCLRFYRKLSSTLSIVSAMSDDWNWHSSSPKCHADNTFRKATR